MMNGARALLESLRQEGVEVVFGYPGGAVLTLYDEVYKMKFPHILTRHEQGAAHAADGYARASGKVGVVFATSGPGATNLVTGIATANMDSVPMVCITGQVANPYIGKDSFQEADIVGVTTPITKHNYLVKDVHDLPRVIKEAFFIARTGRPGVVVIDVAKDVFDAEIDFAPPAAAALRGYSGSVPLDVDAVRAAADALRTAELAAALCRRRRHPLGYGSVCTGTPRLDGDACRLHTDGARRRFCRYARLYGDGGDAWHLCLQYGDPGLRPAARRRHALQRPRDGRSGRVCPEGAHCPL